MPNPNHETQVILETMLLGLEDILSGVPQFVRYSTQRTEVEHNDESSAFCT